MVDIRGQDVLRREEILCQTHGAGEELRVLNTRRALKLNLKSQANLKNHNTYSSISSLLHLDTQRLGPLQVLLKDFD